MRHKFLSSFLALGLVVFGSNFALGQATASATIVGTATDSTGAVIVGARVTATNSATGASRSTTSSANGDFRFDQVVPSTYSVKVSKEGYASYVQSFQILIGQTATVSASLKIGQVSEVVEVHAGEVLVDMAKTEVAQQISPEEVDQMPMLGRDSGNLAYLVPGVKATDSFDPTKARAAVLSVNGGSGRNVNVTVNGVDNKDNTVGGTVMQVPLEAVEEYNISTQRFSAANGRSEGAVINLITKSGGNKFHGSLFSFFRDLDLNVDQKVANGAAAITWQTPPIAVSSLAAALAVPSSKTSSSASLPTSVSASIPPSPIAPHISIRSTCSPASAQYRPRPSPRRSLTPATTAVSTISSTRTSALHSATLRRATTP